MKITPKEIHKLLDRANIQGSLLDLLSDNKTLSYKAFDQISGLYNMTGRQDCLIVIIGFITQNIQLVLDKSGVTI